jgi:hypothetical protein
LAGPLTLDELFKDANPAGMGEDPKNSLVSSWSDEDISEYLLEIVGLRPSYVTLVLK